MEAYTACPYLRFIGAMNDAISNWRLIIRQMHAQNTLSMKTYKIKNSNKTTFTTIWKSYTVNSELDYE